MTVKVLEDRQPRKDGCEKCHVGKLIEMINKWEAA